ncbi:MAG: CopG family transcriptional regulator [Acidobacteriota bacterium]
MPREAVTVRLEPKTRQTLDDIATALDRDRSQVINDALAAYIDVHQWQVAHIKQGLREADAGKFVSGAEVERTLARLRGR